MKKGQYFYAEIDSVECVGIIQQEGKTFYLCQNVQDGQNCDNKLGFAYSWQIGRGTPEEMKDEDVTHFKIITREQFNKFSKKIKLPIHIGDWEVTYSDRKYKFGCGAITLTKQQIQSFVDFYDNNKKNIELLFQITNQLSSTDELPEIVSQTKQQILKK